MNLLQRFKDYISQHHLFSAKDNLILAVSGGVDSVVLCELCSQAGYNFIIAHCNFQLRGEESERDESFVKSLAEKYEVKIEVKKFETEIYAGEKKISIQEAARELRYQWFGGLIRRPEAGSRERENSSLTIHDSPKWTLTAHHADDNIETLLINFFRGTGLFGLTGMPVLSPYAKVRRPLIEFWKEELIQFAKENKLDYVEDSSNQSSRYTRNFFRNEIIPLISKVFPQVKENLRDNIQRFKEIRKLYYLSVKDLKHKLIKRKNEEIHIPIKQLMSYQSRALIFEIIGSFGFNEKQIDEVIKLTGSDSGKYIQSPIAPIRIIKFRHWLIISSSQTSGSDTIVIDEGTKNVSCSTFNIQFSVVGVSDVRLPASDVVAYLDADVIEYPLILRKWKQGDYFYPLGMKKKKKLSRFFIDQKLSTTQKENAWVIEMNKKILWIVGHRIDERFKITDKTKSILKVTLINHQTG